MFGFFAPLRRRWPWLDRLFRALESYISLLDQIGWLGTIKGFGLTAIGLAISAMTYLAESWLPLAIVAGLGGIITLRLLPIAISGLSSRIRPDTDEKLDDHARQLESIKSMFRMTLERDSQVSELSQKVESVQQKTIDLIFKELNKCAENHRLLHDRTAEVTGRLEQKLLDVTVTVEAARERFDAAQRRIETKVDLLVTSLRARDAEAIIKEADACITSLGDRLFSYDPKLYGDDDVWVADYRIWKSNVDRVDQVALAWMEHHRPFLGVRLTDFENGAPPPPRHIVSKTDANAVRFKTVWVVSQRYANEREGILGFFSAKAGNLPS